MTRQGKPILEFPLSEPVNAGIAYQVRWPGLVPEYEEFAAMKTAHYSETEWDGLALDVRARAVAHYRIQRAERAHAEDAQAQHSKHAARRGGKR